MTFGEKLQELRKGSGLSQEEFADRLGISRQSVSKWEQAQTYPETEKLIEISRMFSVTVDSLLKEERELEPLPAQTPDTLEAGKARSVGAAAVLAWVIAAVCAVCAVAFFVQWRLVKAEGDAAQPAAASEQPLEMEALRAYYFDFARTYRVDYIPFFEAGSASTESPEYLFFAYALNLDNWGDDQGIMSREYVEETVWSYFGVSGLSHMSMRKGWDYDGAVYTAYPGGLKELPLYRLDGYRTYEENGTQYYELILECCQLSSGMMPEEGAAEGLREQISEGSMDGLTVLWREQLTYCCSTLNFDKPVFLEHLLLDEAD